MSPLLKPSLLSQRQIKELVAFAEAEYNLQDFDHTLDHVELTVAIAGYLASKEGADVEVCVVSAYLHDIAKNSSQEHAKVGAEEAKAFLKQIQAPDPFIDQVCYAISQHDNDLPKRTKEAEVLWDADKLQSIGPLGFARVFGYRMVYDKRQVYGAVEKAREYTDFFYDRFYTKTGREIAQSLRSSMREFYRLYDAVVSVKFDQLLEGRD